MHCVHGWLLTQGPIIYLNHHHHNHKQTQRALPLFCPHPSLPAAEIGPLAEASNIATCCAA